MICDHYCGSPCPLRGHFYTRPSIGQLLAETLFSGKILPLESMSLERSLYNTRPPAIPVIFPKHDLTFVLNKNPKKRGWLLRIPTIPCHCGVSLAVVTESLCLLVPWCSINNRTGLILKCFLSLKLKDSFQRIWSQWHPYSECRLLLHCFGNPLGLLSLL